MKPRRERRVPRKLDVRSTSAVENVTGASPSPRHADRAGGRPRSDAEHRKGQVRQPGPDGRHQDQLGRRGAVGGRAPCRIVPPVDADVATNSRGESPEQKVDRRRGGAWPEYPEYRNTRNWRVRRPEPGIGHDPGEDHIGGGHQRGRHWTRQDEGDHTEPGFDECHDADRSSAAGEGRREPRAVPARAAPGPGRCRRVAPPSSRRQRSGGCNRSDTGRSVPRSGSRARREGWGADRQRGEQAH